MNHKSIISLLLVIATMLLTNCKPIPEAPIPEAVVTTGSVIEITKYSAQIQVTLVSAENTVITELGLCWGSSPNPEVGDNSVSTQNTAETFCHTLTELQPDTEYHVRAYAFDGLEYFYGDDVCFRTLPIGLFTVYKSSSNCVKVRFSKGNLQYQSSTNTWRFAEHQWDFVGYSEPDQYGFTFGTVEGSSNHLIGPDYDGWIDLFGWGTSGNDHGAVCYQPWSTSTNDADYYAYGHSSSGLNEWDGQADWGSNPISNGGNQANMWRTLTNQEWNYLLKDRNTPSRLKYVSAAMHGIIGVILLPDDWDNSIMNLVHPASLFINQISDEQWQLLEDNGAVFLPKTGVREGNVVSYGYNIGAYWTSTLTSWIGGSSIYPCCVWINGGLAYTNNEYNSSAGLSVRLVQNYVTDKQPEVKE